VWTKNKSGHVGTEDQHAATRAVCGIRSYDLQALRKDSRAGFKEGLKISRKGAKKKAKAQRRTKSSFRLRVFLCAFA
jgi:hypothetical protein